MKHIVVDFEMNPVERKYRKKWECKMEIIQIGAVVLDQDYKEIGSFSTLVKPQYNKVIEAYYQKLTGISTSMVKNAPDFLTALTSFFSWIQSLQDEVSIYAWSDNDLYQLLVECKLKNRTLDVYEENLIHNWIDFQSEFDKKMGLEYQCSLVEGIMLAGISFDGKQHDALDDARNTGYLLAYTRDENQIAHSFRRIMEKQEVSCSTLGDLFDFSQFDFN